MAIPVALELYSVRKTLAKDLEGTLKTLKGYGYEAVEFAGGYEHSPERYRAALAGAGLWVSGWHVSYAGVLSDSEEEFMKEVNFHTAVGNKYLIMSWIPHEMIDTLAALEKTAQKINAACAKLAKYGLYTGYHNHAEAFKVLENGKTIWTTLRELTCPDFVMQMDTGNAMSGGADVNAEIIAAEGRCQILHLKPYSHKRGFETMIGELDDDVDYATILNFCREKGGTHVYVIEYECETLYSDMEGVKLCIDNLKSKYGNLL